MVEQPDLNDDIGQGHAPDTIAAVMRFLRAAWMRKGIILACLMISCAYGAFQYLTSVRKYQSAAQVLVMKTGGEGLRDSRIRDNPRALAADLPTYERIVTSDKVIARALANIPSDYRIDVRGVPPENQIRRFRAGLKVDGVKLTNLLDISYVSLDPKAAAVAVDAVVTAYQEYMNEVHKDNSRELLDILTHEKGDLERNLGEKEQELLRLRATSEFIASKDGQTNEVIRHYQALAAELTQAQSATIQAKAKLAAIRQAILQGKDIQQYLTQEDEALGREIMLKEMGLASDMERSVGIREEQLLKDMEALREKEFVYGPAHPVIQKLQGQIRSNQHWLAEHRNVVAQSTRQIRYQKLQPQLLAMAEQRVAQAMEHEQYLQQQVDYLKPQAIGLNNQFARIEMINLDLKRLRSLYDLLLDRMKDIDLGQNNGMKISVVTEPSISNSPVSPQLRKIAMISLIAGLGIGLGLVYLLDLMDDRFRSPEEIKLQLGTPVIAMVRQLERIEGKGIECVYAHARPKSVGAESFRTLRTVLSFSESKARRIVVTSSEPGDGKSTVISNLAVTYAQAGQKTLLIEADMRRPGITDIMDLPRTQGLSTILRENRSVSEVAPDCILSSPDPLLDIIPAGPRPANPAELLANERFSELLGWAETIYDQILVDAPPVLAVADPTIISSSTDGTILVVNPEKNRRRVLFRAMESLRSVKLPVLGIVVNNLSAEDMGSGYGYGYGYGYGNEYGYGHDADEQPDEEASVIKVQNGFNPEFNAAGNSIPPLKDAA